MQHEIKQLREIPGLMACVLTHKIQMDGSTAQYKWTGPKLNEEWPAILAFFKWTFDTMRSESQVRLFVNERTKVWKAWAFPQKAKTGMNANEITEADGADHYAKVKEQRAMFPDTEGWTYYGTVHHHCAVGAFQSSTDTQNEQNQDGIHITVGNMDKPVHDIHFRLYQSGLKLTSVKPMDFWDIGNLYQSVPEQLRSILVPDWVDRMVALAMGTPTPGATFPDIWKANVIDCTPKIVSTPTASGGVSYSQHGYQGHHQPNYQNMRRLFVQRSTPNLDSDLKKARWEIMGFLASPHTKIAKIDQVLDKIELLHMQCDDDDYNLLDICMRNDVTPSALFDYIVQIGRQEERLAEERLKRLQEGGPLEDPKEGKKGKKGQSVTQQLNPAQLDLEIQRGRVTSGPTVLPHWSDQNFEGYKGVHGGHEGQGNGA